MAANSKRGFSLHIFLPHGSPDGLRIIEKSNWDGLGLVCPRAQFAEAKSRTEFSRTGVYMLLGPTGSELPRLYVGEGDPVRPRLEQHAARKDFWTSAVLFTGKRLNKAHVQYLEARLVALAEEAKRCELDNGNRPDLPTLSEAEIAEVEGFLDEVRLCLPILGVGLFEKPPALSHPAGLLHLNAKGITARGYESGDGFVVMAGSQAVGVEVPSVPPAVTDLRKHLLEKGVLKEMGGILTFTDNYLFNSPSLAAGVLLARSANGRTEWRDDKGRTLRDIQDALPTVAT